MVLAIVTVAGRDVAVSLEGVEDVRQAVVAMDLPFAPADLLDSLVEVRVGDGWVVVGSVTDAQALAGDGQPRLRLQSMAAARVDEAPRPASFSVAVSVNHGAAGAQQRDINALRWSRPAVLASTGVPMLCAMASVGICIAQSSGSTPPIFTDSSALEAVFASAVLLSALCAAQHAVDLASWAASKRFMIGAEWATTLSAGFAIGAAMGALSCALGAATSWTVDVADDNNSSMWAAVFLEGAAALGAAVTAVRIYSAGAAEGVEDPLVAAEPALVPAAGPELLRRFLAVVLMFVGGALHTSNEGLDTDTPLVGFVVAMIGGTVLLALSGAAFFKVGGRRSWGGGIYAIEATLGALMAAVFVGEFAWVEEAVHYCHEVLSDFVVDDGMVDCDASANAAGAALCAVAALLTAAEGFYFTGQRVLQGVPVVEQREVDGYAELQGTPASLKFFGQLLPGMAAITALSAGSALVMMNSKNLEYSHAFNDSQYSSYREWGSAIGGLAAAVVAGVALVRASEGSLLLRRAAAGFAILCGFFGVLEAANPVSGYEAGGVTLSHSQSNLIAGGATLAVGAVLAAFVLLRHPRTGSFPLGPNGRRSKLQAVLTLCTVALAVAGAIQMGRCRAMTLEPVYYRDWTFHGYFCSNEVALLAALTAVVATSAALAAGSPFVPAGAQPVMFGLRLAVALATIVLGVASVVARRDLHEYIDGGWWQWDLYGSANSYTGNAFQGAVLALVGGVVELLAVVELGRH